MSAKFCQCGPFLKAAAHLRHYFGRPARRPKIDGACRNCGLLPQGDRVAEYVLKIKFTDGKFGEFACRGSRPEDRFRIAGNTFQIEMSDCCLTYSLSAIEYIGFCGQVVPAVEPVAAEVAEAERIIAAKPSGDDSTRPG